jgi:trk system potassium uptake protein TrkA
VINIPLMEMKLKADVLVAAIIRDGKVRIPRGQDVICVGDGVIIVSKLHAMHDVSDILR